LIFKLNHFLIFPFGVDLGALVLIIRQSCAAGLCEEVLQEGLAVPSAAMI
jgi:hypothetical protein